MYTEYIYSGRVNTGLYRQNYNILCEHVPNNMSTRGATCTRPFRTIIFGLHSERGHHEKRIGFRCDVVQFPPAPLRFLYEFSKCEITKEKKIEIKKTLL